MKRTLKTIAKTLLGIIIFIALYLAMAFICSRITVNSKQSAKDDVTIYIKTNGVHTDIVVPVVTNQIDWSREIKYTNTSLTDTNCQYLALGWGDKGFYLQTPNWSDLKFSVAFNAAFGLSTTAMHATYYTQLTESDRCKKILISQEEYTELIKYILSSFQKDANGHLIYINTRANYSNSDAFYEATGHYSLFYTCNTWANAALKKCSQKACLWTIFDTPIFSKY